MPRSESILRILPVFLLGKTPDPIMGNGKAQQDAQADRVLQKYGLGTESKLLIRKEKEVLGANLHSMDAFIIFPYCSDRFAPLIYLAETKKPIIIVSEEDTFLNALETYQYLADHDNVELAVSPREVKANIQAIETSKLLQTTKVGLFDAGEWKLEGIAWQKNPLFSNILNIENINMQKFLKYVRTADSKEAEALAKKWMKNAKVLEPSLADAMQTARIYLGIKRTLREMKANAAYVLWCGQFTKKLQNKMCFALAKLADDGYPTGCWRGENLLPMLMLHAVSKKPVFVAEAFTHKGDTITLRHCFAPTKLTRGKYVLRRWRNMEGTVTGYCQLPKGQVTLVNCGIGDRMVVAKGNVVDCKDLGGQNCRMTVWVRMEKPELIARFVAREFAMVYGDCEEESMRTAERLGLKVLR
jgi:L-fucose isomerase-like protein